jgi:hypothetical protein
METIFLKNIHFLLFDKWFEELSESEQQSILQNTPGLENYLGIHLKSEVFDEEKGFEFEVMDVDRWTKMKQLHEFLQNLE